jgi:DNA-binding Lrp family transcriptional regulator
LKNLAEEVELTPELRETLEYIEKKCPERVTVREVAEALGITYSAAYYRLARLWRLDKIRRETETVVYYDRPRRRWISIRRVYYVCIIVYRVHKATMYYRPYRKRYTPDPFAMICTFVYTKTPDHYTEEEFDEKLKVLETEVAWSLAGYPSNLIKVQGIEREQVDPDEVEHPEDQQRWYIAFYRIGADERVYTYKEYWGTIRHHPETGEWEITDETDHPEKEPKFKKSPERFAL